MSIAAQEGAFPAKTVWARFVLLWLAGNVAAYSLTSFFSNFYPSLFEFIVLSLGFQLLCGMGTVLLCDAAGPDGRLERCHDPLTLLVLFIGLSLSSAAVMMAWQFPGLFHRRILFMPWVFLPLFALIGPVSLAASIAFRRTGSWVRLSMWLRQTPFFKFTQENRPGILLTILFLFTYLTLAESINFPGFRTLDEYFDTDISTWIQRLTSTTPQDVSLVRAVHPAVLIFLRPLVWLISIFLHGDRLQAVFVLNALAGAGCVLLTWLIVKRASGNTAYALLSASLLGASASHLLLGSMLETYIYSALALLLFIFLIQNEHTSLGFTVPAGILVFGITVTNLIQTCLLYFFKYPRLKVLIKFVLAVVFITAALNLLQVWMYPNARLFFVPSNLLHEKIYASNPLDFSWRTAGRLALIARAIPLYGMVAPTPFVLTKEIGMEYPNFRTYRILLGQFHVAAYRGLADVTVKFWILILMAAGVLFILDLFKSPRQVLLPLSLALCLGFSFALHLVYGDDPMLYSPDWVYALVLFVALNFQRWADRTWLKLLMIAFLILLLNANLRLIYQIMSVSAPYFSR